MSTTTTTTDSYFFKFGESRTPPRHSPELFKTLWSINEKCAEHSMRIKALESQMVRMSTFATEMHAAFSRDMKLMELELKKLRAESIFNTNHMPKVIVPGSPTVLHLGSEVQPAFLAPEKDWISEFSTVRVD